MNKLVFLVPTIGAALAIPKPMIFVNGLDDGMTLAYYLCKILSAHMKNDEKKIIRTFTLVLEPNAKEEYLKDFCNSDTRIWICTDGAE